jgi:A-macroglobulin TED domain/Alpha-2-macroglobulin family/Carboxypeptidase regulatory-like domain/MG2 domain/A-macroglobulin receptor binding domain/Macroglobulin domain MG3
MRSARRVRLLAILFVIVSSALLASSDPVHLNESEMSAVVAEREIALVVTVSNDSEISGSGTLHVDLIDPTDAVIASAESTEQLNHGRSSISLHLARGIAGPFRNGDDPVLWYRVRYRLLLDGKPVAKGTVALGAIAPDMFELRVAHADKGLLGQPYRVNVHAANPVTRRPVSGVQIRGDLEFDSNNQKIVVTKVTNSSGDAVLLFNAAGGMTESGSVKIEAQKRDQKRDENFDFDLDSRLHIVINTDKLLYQPGQSLHARAIVLGTDKHAIANEDAEFKLIDSESKTVFSGTAKTNAFGIASIDWDLPDSIELGPYELAVSFSDEDPSAGQITNVRISRYDLPNFSIAAKPDRAYYLPGQNASVEISAKYLFGKELTRGSVKLVREEQGHWDSTQHKWVVDEADQQTGELDHSGLATFKLDFAKLHQELAEQTYSRFKDLDFAAYVTDPSTGKTEQRRFHVRLSHEPIHVYVSGMELNGDRGSFYVSTYYPDGTPAECHVNISEDRDHNNRENHSSGMRDFLRTIKTDRFGVAKISNLQLLSENGGNDSSNSQGYQLIFDVHDKGGATVSYDEGIWNGSDNSVQVTTDKSLYQANDQVLVSVRANSLAGHVIVDLSRDGAMLWTGRINLHNHRGFTVIPFLPQFKGPLTVAAYSLETDAETRYEIPSGSRTIMFPSPSTLAVKVKTDHTTYKPGEDVSAALNISLPNGSAAASALGVVVVDKAVEERIRTDEDFGEGHYGFWDWSWWYSPVSVGGISLQDLDELDLSKPLPDGMDLVADMILQSGNSYREGLPDIEGYEYGSETLALFSARMRNELDPFRKAVLDKDAPEWKFATNNAELASVLRKSKLDPENIVDPWGTPYHYEFGIDYRNRTLNVLSAGPDKQFGTADDIETLTIDWPYFEPFGKIIDRVVKDTYASSDAYIRDLGGLSAAVLARGLDLKALRDPWGNPYEFSFQTSGSMYQVNVGSTGRNASHNSYGSFFVWTSAIDYFGQARVKIDSAIFKLSRSTGSFPQDDASFNKALVDSGINFRQLVDPWGHAYFVKYSVESEYGDTTKITYQSDSRIQTGTAVTRKLAWIRIFSSGPDGQANTPDDFAVASFSRDIAEQSGKDIIPQAVSSESLSENTGAINGVVTDPSGAVVPNATITVTLRQTSQVFTAISGPDGTFVVRNIPPGTYDVSVSSPGFRATQVRTVPVHSTSVTSVNVRLDVGATMETVEVSAGSVLAVQAVTSQLASVSKSVEGTKAQIHEETFTPRLRDYFPETLFWSPSVITDVNGRARLKFKLADNITTWKMTVLASTKNGEIGVSESEIQTFQPFFLEHDPPKILTIGDVIDLPVVVRNYLPQTQQLNVEMKPAAWFNQEHPGKQQISVEAGESTTAVFPFRATAMVKSGKQQVYAANHTTGDAIEKTVTVHPDGQEQISTVASILRGNDSLSLHVPANFISGSLRAQLKIYPNALAQVTESIEAGLERPYGCGEQTVSSTYPSVMLLKYYRATGRINGPMQARASRYVTLGYHRLLNYREADGGFSYWGHDSPDVALTAYAIRFLSDASAFTDVDPEVIHNAAKWLIGQQRKDGSLQPAYGYDDGGLTAYVAVTLAQSEELAPDPLKKSVHESVACALDYLSDPHRNLNAPYELAEYAIAAEEFGDEQRASSAVARLAKLAGPEHGGMYWALEHNTPFYGWGRTGRIESTAMAVLALSKADSSTVENRRLMDAGIYWLLQQKDRYGVWYSGQATVDVLEALLEVDTSKPEDTDAKFHVLINGKSTQEQDISAHSDAPAIIDISDLIQSGDNTIAVQSATPLHAASMQAVADYYISWTGPAVTESTRPGNSDALRLAVKFDKTEARAGEDVQCSVDAERIGSSGWGMMIAEIGLPPGTDVDRKVLDDVITSSGWTISHYDVLPDRLVLYLWPHAGGSKLTFKFRPRYGLKARTASSILYDYYNPEAQVSLPPADFNIQAGPRAESAKTSAAK